MSFKLIVKKSESIKGALVFGLFDAIAAYILGEFSIIRLLGMSLMGATFYATEIPSFFAWIEHKSQSMKAWHGKLYKTLMTAVYFNPLWVARHMCLIYLLNRQSFGWEVMNTAWLSFWYGLPVSLLANYVIQNHIVMKYRFLASAIFSGCMVVFYAVSAVYFK
ncbi:MAG: hypothetical protein R3E90_00735 [Marinicella sp.]|nr:hypothetical protein [Xanthomonadales bacterium]